MAKKVIKYNQDIEKLRDQWDEVPFRMALYHMIDVGVSNISDEKNVNYTLKKIAERHQEEEEAERQAKERGEFPQTISIMTCEFEQDIVRHAHELSKFNISDILKYVTERVYIG
jgi:hypothetical protein